MAKKTRLTARQGSIRAKRKSLVTLAYLLKSAPYFLPRQRLTDANMATKPESQMISGLVSDEIHIVRIVIPKIIAIGYAKTNI